jgi:hypothetical protein
LFGVRIITDRSLFPECIRHFTEIKGLSIGGCLGGILGKDSVAHSHSKLATKPSAMGKRYHGFICFRNQEVFENTETLLHEAAHILLGEKETISHGSVWQEKALSIGVSQHEINEVLRRIKEHADNKGSR